MSRYPSDKELDAIAEWDYHDLRSCFEFIEEIWAYPDYIELTDEKCELSTGGWSGNEDIVGAMQDNMMLWMLTWEQSRRGGHYIFDLTRIPNE